MKKIVFFAIFLFLSVTMQAQTTVQTTAGNLETDLDGKTVDNHLIIKGTMNFLDFQYIKNSLKNLQTLDLSGVTEIKYHEDDYTGREYAEGEIPREAFYGHAKLTKLIMPTATAVNSIGMMAFTETRGLTGEFVVPPNITNLAAGAFRNAWFSKIVLPEGLKTIPEDCFHFNAFNAKSPLQSVNIPSTVTAIDPNAFAGNVLINTFKLPQGLKELSLLGTFANTGISSLTIPSGVQAMENPWTPGEFPLHYAFNGTKFTEQPAVPANVNVIEGDAFGNTAIKKLSLTWPALTKILDFGLGNMPELTEVEFGATVNFFGYDVFRNNPKLTVVKVHNPVPATISADPNNPNNNSFSEFNVSKATLYVPAGAKTAYQNAEHWKTFGTIVEFGGAPSITVPSDKLDIVAGASATKLALVANTDWVAASNQPWLTVSPATGTTNAELTFTAQENSGAVRTALVEIFNPNNLLQPVLVTITQAGTDKQIQHVEGFDKDAKVMTDEGSIVPLPVKTKEGLTIQYSIESGKEKVASLEGNRVTFLTAGEVKITASNEGSAEYAPLDISFTIATGNVYSWMEAPSIAVEGYFAKLVGPKEMLAKFIKFYVNDTEVELKDGIADLTDKTGELSLKATTADGSEIIKLKINKQ